MSLGVFSFTNRRFLHKFPQDEIELLMSSRNLDLSSNFYGRACKYMEQHAKGKYSVEEIHVMYFTMHRCLAIALECLEDSIWKHFCN